MSQVTDYRTLDLTGSMGSTQETYEQNNYTILGLHQAKVTCKSYIKVILSRNSLTWKCGFQINKIGTRRNVGLSLSLRSKYNT